MARPNLCLLSRELPYPMPLTHHQKAFMTECHAFQQAFQQEPVELNYKTPQITVETPEVSKPYVTAASKAPTLTWWSRGGLHTTTTPPPRGTTQNNGWDITFHTAAKHTKAKQPKACARLQELVMQQRGSSQLFRQLFKKVHVRPVHASHASSLS